MDIKVLLMLWYVSMQNAGVKFNSVTDLDVPRNTLKTFAPALSFYVGGTQQKPEFIRK